MIHLQTTTILSLWLFILTLTSAYTLQDSAPILNMNLHERSQTDSQFLDRRNMGKKIATSLFTKQPEVAFAKWALNHKLKQWNNQRRDVAESMD